MHKITAIVVGLSALFGAAVPAAAQAEPERSVVAWMTDDGRVHKLELPTRAVARARVATLRERADVLAADVASPVHAFSSDPLRSAQWPLDRVESEQARKYATGSGVTVAVLDTGVDSTHPDLSGAVLSGFDAVDGTTRGGVDPNGHGTHVAGIVAAVTGNGQGVASLGGGARILPVRVLDATGNGTTADVAEGIVWATDKGVDVINLSLGGTSYDSVLESAVKYALRHGVVMVAAAGNLASFDPVYPAAFPGVIGVTATDDQDRLFSYASTGWWVDLSAPGVNVLSTFPGASYVLMSGTSMAAPMAAGLSALLLTRQPSLTPLQVRSRLIHNSQDIGKVGRDKYFGYGLVHASSTMLPAQRFDDISGLSHAANIVSLAETRLTRGCAATRYCPDRKITRAEMASFLARALRLAPSSTNYFDDTAGSVHEKNINAIYEAGITVGCKDKTVFCPDDRVSRAEMATFLSRALGLKTVKSNYFSDVDPSSSHAGYINAIYERRITLGCKDKTVYCPARAVTRAEMATFLARAFHL